MVLPALIYGLLKFNDSPGRCVSRGARRLAADHARRYFDGLAAEVEALVKGGSARVQR